MSGSTVRVDVERARGHQVRVVSGGLPQGPRISVVSGSNSRSVIHNGEVRGCLLNFLRRYSVVLRNSAGQITAISADWVEFDRQLAQKLDVESSAGGFR